MQKMEGEVSAYHVGHLDLFKRKERIALRTCFPLEGNELNLACWSLEKYAQASVWIGRGSD
jgi:hypothetical protein